MSEPDFSKMSTREILMWEIKNAKTQVVKIDTVEIEKEVWESTLNRSMVLQAENDKLKELLKECREFFYENLIGTEFHFNYGLGSDIKKQSCIKSLSNLMPKIKQALGEDKYE